MPFDSSLAIYAIPLLLILLIYRWQWHREAARSTMVLSEAQVAGLTDPASLHPVIDPRRCMGCGSCVAACPEGKILGLIDGRAELIEPTHCIGHGACKAACPFDAISLVFGTAERGVDIPNVGSDFQTNVPGVYIAGELGGMGLIRNAIEQGRQALAAVAKSKRPRALDTYDVVIVGAGPAGFSASLAAMEQKLSYLTIEQDTLGGTVAHFPRGKIVMTQPAMLPMVGKVKFRETTKEALLEFWQGIMLRTQVKIRFNERLEAILPSTSGARFNVRTTSGTYKSNAVLLAIGRRGTPRKLDVPGEDLNKVVYRVDDPAQYRGKHVLVVGGGDSAIEAAVAVADETGTKVTLAYRGDAFSRCKPKNRQAIEARAAQSKVEIVFKASVKDITPDSIRLKCEDKVRTLKNDAVIVCAGGILPTGFLKGIGVEIETKYGMA